MLTVGSIVARMRLDDGQFRTSVASVRSTAQQLATSIRASLQGARGALQLDGAGFRASAASIRRSASNLAAHLKTQFQQAGQYIGAQFRNMGQELSSMLSSRLTGTLALGAIALGIREAFREADLATASIRTLGATARITGQSLAFMEGVAGQAKTQFQLSTVLANGLTIELTRLAAKAGDVAMAGPGLQAFLDLGAARGLTAEQTLAAVRQAILGIDEGTDKLFGVNPSALYERLAQQLGRSAASLSETEKAQAILNAAMEDGSRVAGEYARFLETAAGKSALLQVRLDETQASLGRALEPMRLVASEVLLGVMPVIGRAIAGLQELGARLAVFAANMNVRRAESHESWGRWLAGILDLLARFIDAVVRIPPGIRAMLGLGAVNFVVDNLRGWADGIREHFAGAVDDARLKLGQFQEAAAAVRAEISATWDTAGAAGGGAAGTNRPPTPPGARPPVAGAAPPAVVDRPLVADRPLALDLDVEALEQEAERAVSWFERMGTALRRALLPAKGMVGDLTQAIGEGLAGAAETFASSIGKAFDLMLQGGLAAGEAFARTMLNGLAEVARGFGRFFSARALAEAAGLNFPAAAGFTAAAVAMYALGGWAGAGAARSGNDNHGGGGLDRAAVSAQVAELQPMEITIFVPDPLNPDSYQLQDVVYVAGALATERHGKGATVNVLPARLAPMRGRRS